MRSLPDGLARHLAGGVTTHARLWRLTRTDGVVLGFTDHDRTLTLDGIVHEPAAGFTASEVPASLGLSVDTAEVTGALVSPVLTEDDLASGLYDGARIELWLVDWERPDDRILLEAGAIGEITRAGALFRAEMRSLAHVLDQERGRILQATCDAEFGDARCGIDPAAHRSEATVSAVIDPRTVRLTGPDARDGAATGGRLAWTSGANAGRGGALRRDRAEPSGRVVELWDEPGRPIAPGDACTITEGCDKRFSTCRDRFANAANFRGFPAMPGSEASLAYAAPGDGNDGAPLT